MKIVILGAGLVGREIARDLANDQELDICAVDIDWTALEKLGEYESITTTLKDLSDIDNIKEVICDCDFVFNALQGFMGFTVLKAVLEQKKNIIDISFFSQNPFELDELAKENGVMGIVDCGVAPGMSNLFVGYASSLLDKIESVSIYVGGLPEKREWPFEYRALFSVSDVLEEYIQPVQLKESGMKIIKPALSDVENFNFHPLGSLEAFNTNGLRTLIDTIDADNMKEKTLRYPGHVEKIKLLKDSGFLSKEKIKIGTTTIRPLDFTSALLSHKWKLNDDELDLTLMEVIVEGIKGNRRKRYIFHLNDRYDEISGVHSMARTTGFTASSFLQMIRSGLYSKTGISPLEFAGREEKCVNFMLNYMKEKGVVYKTTILDL